MGDFRIDGYRIYRSGDGETFINTGYVQYPHLTYYDNEATHGKIYHYQVRADCYLGAGAPSNTASGFADQSEPQLKIIHPELNQWLNTRDVYVAWEGSDFESGISHYRIRIDYRNWISIYNSTSYLIQDLDRGEHRVDLRAYNSVGMFTSYSVDFFLDFYEPILDLQISNISYTNQLSRLIQWDAEDVDSGISTNEYRLNKGPWVETDHTFADIFLLPGGNTFEVRVFDLAGNMAQDMVTIIYDGDDPIFSSVNPDNTSEIYTNDEIIELSWRCEDQISGIRNYILSINYENNHEDISLEISNTSHILDLEEGSYRIILSVWDHAGNNAFQSWEIHVDRTPPTLVSYFPQGGLNPVDTNISVVFKERMFVGSVFFQVKDVSGRLSWTGNRLTFYPHQLLEFGSTYEVEVYGSDPAANYMQSFSWEFSTLPSGTIRGRVLGDRGRPMFDATVTLGNGGIFYTDNQGRFGFEVPPGDYTLTIEKDGYGIITMEVSVNSGDDKNLGNIRLKKEGSVSEIGLILLIGIPAVLIISILIVISAVVIRKRKWSMEFYVVDGEPIKKKRPLVEFEEDEDRYESEFEIIDYNGSPDYYSVLGIDRYASPSEIKRAYRNMAYMYHPDKLQAAGIDMDMKEIHVMMRELNEAKDTLLDPMKRQAYDISHLDNGL
jgi:hypothetical protein